MQNAYIEQVKHILLTVFVIEPFVAVDQIMARHLRPRTGEVVCINRKIARTTYGVCIRVWSHARRTLRASSRMHDMTFSQVLTSAQAIMTDEKESEKTVAAATQPAETHDNPPQLLIVVAI